MITIHDARATVRLADIDEEVRNITIDVTYSDDKDEFDINNIVLALAKQKVDDIKTNAALDVLHKLNRFVADNGIRCNSFIDVINAAADCAKEKGLTLAEYLVKYANK